MDNIKFKASMILSEGSWEITVPIGVFPCEETAQAALNSSNAYFKTRENKHGVLILNKNGQYFLNDSDVSIRELTEACLSRLGAPIDCSSPVGISKSVKALKDMDAAYMVTENDFIESDKSLSDFIKNYGDGYSPDHIADKIEKSTGDVSG